MPNHKDLQDLIDQIDRIEIEMKFRETLRRLGIITIPEKVIIMGDSHA